MKKTTLLFSLLLIAFTTYSQITFQRVIGVDNGPQETGESILQTSGGYMLAGYSTNAAVTNSAAMIIKTGPTGLPLWNKRFGGTGWNQFVSSFEASDGSFYFAGYRESATTYNDVYVVKTDAAGTAIWEKTFNMPSQETALEIRDGGSGNVVVVTDVGSVIRISSAGAILWQKLYTNVGLCDIIHTSDGGFMIAGTSNVTGAPQLIKTDVNGAVTWSKTYASSLGSEVGNQVVEAGDGSFYFACTKQYIFPSVSDNNLVLLKTSSTGVLTWCNAYALNGEHMEINDMITTSDGGVVVCGQGPSITGVSVKVNSSGVKQWDAKYGANQSMAADHVTSVVQTTDGGFAYTGRSYSFGTANSLDDFYLVKTDGNANTGSCAYKTTIGYSTLAQTWTAATVTQTSSTATFTLATVSSSLTAATVFTNLACAVTTAPIVADFTANTTTILAGGTVDFTDLSTNFPTSWSWSFTGGTPATATSQNPSGVAYSAIGCYAVTLTATNASSSDAETKTCYIHVVQDSSTSFQRSIGLDTSRQETGESILQTAGGYMLAGYSANAAVTASAAMIIKTSASGAPLWHKQFGSSGWNQFVSSFEASDGSFYFAGYRESATTYNDVYVVKTDAAGTAIWEKTFNMPSQETALEIRDGGSGNVVVVTDVGSVIRISSAGAILWQKLYTNVGLCDVIHTSDGGFMIAGTSNVTGAPQLIKTDVNGAVTWSKTYASSLGSEVGNQVVEASDGSFYFACTKQYIFPSVSDNNLVLLKTSSTGVLTWCNAYALNGEHMEINDMITTSDGGVIVCGQGPSITGVSVKVNSSGVKQWDAKYGANQSMAADHVTSVVQTTDGGFAYTGRSYSFGTANSLDDFYFVKTDASGTTGGCYQTTIGYSTIAQTWTAATVTQTSSTATFTLATVSSSLPTVALFTNLACAPVVPGTYCSINSTTGTSDGDYVNGVILGTINNNNSGSLGGPFYTDYTATLSTNLAKSTTYTLQVKSGAWQAGYPDYYAAWIDYNQDGDFSDAGEKLGEFLSSAANTTQNIVFAVPAASTSGTTRMRVRGAWNTTGNLDPCAAYNYGETEDYKIVIVTGSAPVANFSANFTSIAAGGTVNFTDLSTNTPISWVWNFTGAVTTSSTAQNPTNIQYNTPGCYTVTLTATNSFGSDPEVKNCYINVTAAGSAPVANFSANFTSIVAGGTVNFTDLSTNTPTSWAWNFTGAVTTSSTAQNPTNIQYNTPGCYTVTLTATNSFGSDPEVKNCYITVTSSSVTYCVIPTPTYGTSDGDYIDGVVLGSISNNNSGSTTGPFYTDYTTSMSTNLTTSTSYTLAVKSGTWLASYPDYYAAWIDYNQDGDFDDAGEKLGEFLSTAPSTSQNIVFSVPAAATTGITRMRVRGVWTTTAGIDPCALYSYGETEDYKIVIVSPVSVQTQSLEENILSIYPNPNKGVFSVRINATEEDKLSLKLMNAIGQVLINKVITSDRKEHVELIDASEYANGIYYILLQSESMNVSKKVIITK